MRWVVPYTAGGATDVPSRLIGQRLSERLGQPFIVENKPGACSNLGTQAVIDSPADGYTLLLTSTANAINASFDPSLPYDFAKGIVPVAGLARIPLVLVVNNDLPVRNAAEFIAYAKANPGKHRLVRDRNLASSFRGVVQGDGRRSVHARALSRIGSGPDRRHVGPDPEHVRQCHMLVRAGPVGKNTRNRGDDTRSIGNQPDVPPISDTLPGFETSSFYGVGAPRGTPREIVDLLNKEINAALAGPAILQRLGELGAIAISGDAGQFGAMLTAETDRWRKVVEMSGQRKE